MLLPGYFSGTWLLMIPVRRRYKITAAAPAAADSYRVVDFLRSFGGDFLLLHVTFCDAFWSD